MRFPDSKTLTQIGYTYVINLMDTVTAMGKEIKENIKPYGLTKKNALLKEYELMDKIYEAIVAHEDFAYKLVHTLSRTKDIRNTFLKTEHATLTEVELYEIKYFSALSMEIYELLKDNNAFIEGIAFNPLNELYTLLDPDNTGIMTFYLYDSYDKRLKDIREQKKKIEAKIYTVKEKDALLLKRSEIVAIEEDISFQVREDLTAKIKEYMEKSLQNFKSIGILDFEIQKLLLARKYDCTKPIITDDDTVILTECVHPEIKYYLEKKQKEFIPTSVELRNGVTLLTGANMGGKSVTMKNVTLNAYLCQIGFYPFAKYAKVPVFDFIHFVSSDLQSVEQGLSTFGAEMLKLKEVIMYANATKGFIVLDEFARGTNPKEGKSMVEGVSEYLSGKSSITFISTHYDGISAKLSKRYQVIGLKNVDFTALKYKIDLNKKQSVDILQQYMDYRLEEVTENVVPKDALHIATLLGVQEDVIDCIKKWY